MADTTRNASGPRLIFVTQRIDPADPVLGITVDLIRALGHICELTVIANEVTSLPADLPARVFSLGKESGGPRIVRVTRYLRTLELLTRSDPPSEPSALFAHMCPCTFMSQRQSPKPAAYRCCCGTPRPRAIAPSGSRSGGVRLDGTPGREEPPAAPPLRLVAVCRLVAHKRLDVVLDALAQVPGVTLDIVGEGPEAPGLAHHVRALGLEDRVAFSGALRHDDVLRHLAAAERYKGVDVLLEAWHTVQARMPQARLILVGTGSQLPALRARVECLGLSTTVTFAGTLPQTALGGVLDESSLLVLPSRSEGLGRVILEAHARGRPVVAAAAGGIPELVKEGGTGLLVPPEHPGALAEALLSLLTDRPRQAAMGAPGRAWVEARDPQAEFEAGVARLAAYLQDRGAT